MEEGKEKKEGGREPGETEKQTKEHLLRGPSLFGWFFHLLKVFNFLVVHHMDSTDYNTGYLDAAVVDTLPAEGD